MTNPATVPASRALTTLDEDERLFRDSVLEFARGEIAPLVREMDEHAKFPRTLIDKLFDLGVMGIEVPEALRRRGRARSSTPCSPSRRSRGWTRRSACSWTCRTRSSSTP